MFFITTTAVAAASVITVCMWSQSSAHASDWWLLAGSYASRDTLREWQDKNHPWLELTDIHRETTENIRVTVMPFYIGSRVSSIRQSVFQMSHSMSLSWYALSVSCLPVCVWFSVWKCIRYSHSVLHPSTCMRSVLSVVSTSHRYLLCTDDISVTSVSVSW